MIQYSHDEFGYDGYKFESYQNKRAALSKEVWVKNYATDDRNLFHILHCIDKQRWIPSARKKLIKEGRAVISLGNASSLPFSSDSMDIVTAFETVYFWEKIDKCFAEVYRLLKEDGVFLVTNELKAEEAQPDKYAKLESILDLNIYTAEELADNLKKAGFAEIKTEIKGKDWICVIAKKKG